MLDLLVSFQHLAALIIIAGLFILIKIGILALKKSENRRLKTAKVMEVTEAVETDAPEADSENAARKRAMSSIKERFAHMRRVFTISMTIIGFLILFTIYLPGISSTYITLIAGIIVLLSGMVARPIVENFIAGLVLTFSQPIRIGDTVIIDEKYGTVEKISMLHTTIKVWNWQRFIVPNQKLLNKELENLTIIDEFEWVHVNFWVSPDSDFDTVEKIAKAAITSSKYLESIEPPSFWIMDIEKNSVKCWIAGWADSPANAWELKSETRKNLLNAMKSHNIKFHLHFIQTDP